MSGPRLSRTQLHTFKVYARGIMRRYDHDQRTVESLVRLGLLESASPNGATEAGRALLARLDRPERDD